MSYTPPVYTSAGGSLESGYTPPAFTSAGGDVEPLPPPPTPPENPFYYLSSRAPYVTVVRLTLLSNVYDYAGWIYDEPDAAYEEEGGAIYFSDIEYGDNFTNWHSARVIGDVAYVRRGEPSLFGTRSGDTPGGVGNIELINDDGELDYLVTGYQRGARVDVFTVRQDHPMTQSIQIAASVVRQIEAREESAIRIVTGDILSLLDVPLQTSIYAEGDGAAALVGQVRPVSIGNPLSCPLTLVNDVDYEYDAHDSSGFSIVTVRDNGFPLDLDVPPNTGYMISTTPGINGITLLQTPEGRVVADVSVTAAVSVDIIGAAEGDFDTDITDWTAAEVENGGGVVTISWDATGAAKIETDMTGVAVSSSSAGSLTFPTSLSAGQRYDYSVDYDFTIVAAGGGTDLAQILFVPDDLNPTNYVNFAYILANGTGTVSGTFTAPVAGKFQMRSGATFGGETVTLFDNVRLTAVAAGSNVTDAIEYLLARARVGVDQIDSDSLAALDASRPWPVSHWSDRAEQIYQVIQKVLDSVFGFMYTNSAGQIAVGHLQPPEVGTSVLDLTEYDLAGEVEVSPDFAPGLSATVAGARNWYVYAPSELADALDDDLMVLLSSDFRIRKTATNPVGVELGERTGLPVSRESSSGIATLLDNETHIQAAADYLAELYPAGVPRRFYRIPVFIDVSLTATLNPGDKVTLTYDRFGCQSTRPLRLVNIEGRVGDQLAILTCWGSALGE